MFSVSVLKEYPSKAGGYFYTGVAKADGELSFFPRVNQYPDGNIKVSIPAHVSILSEKIAEQMTTAFIEAVKKHHENPATEPTEEITFGDEKILSSVESHLTPTIDGSTPTVSENTTSLTALVKKCLGLTPRCTPEQTDQANSLHFRANSVQTESTIKRFPVPVI